MTPRPVRVVGAITAFQGFLAIAVAITLAIREFGGHKEVAISGYGTAGWFAIMGSAVLAAGWALWTGRRWGRGLAVFAQLILLGVAWYVGVGSGQWLPGVAIAVVVLAVLALLFSPSALQWAGAQDSPAAEDASADNSGPDTR